MYKNEVLVKRVLLIWPDFLNRKSPTTPCQYEQYFQITNLNCKRQFERHRKYNNMLIIITVSAHCATTCATTSRHLCSIGGCNFNSTQVENTILLFTCLLVLLNRFFKFLKIHGMFSSRDKSWEGGGRNWAVFTDVWR